jgi:hypothetical protein
MCNHRTTDLNGEDMPLLTFSMQVPGLGSIQARQCWSVQNSEFTFHIFVLLDIDPKDFNAVTHKM